MNRRIAREQIRQSVQQRHMEDQILAEADRLGDQAPELLREVAASVREHRESAARSRARQVELDEFTHEFQKAAWQLNQPELAEQWYRMGVAPREAARWANHGYLPEHARHRIAAGQEPHSDSAGRVSGQAALAETAHQLHAAIVTRRAAETEILDLADAPGAAPALVEAAARIRAQHDANHVDQVHISSEVVRGWQAMDINKLADTLRYYTQRQEQAAAWLLRTKPDQRHEAELREDLAELTHTGAHADRITAILFDKLTPQQRETLLDNMDPDDQTLAMSAALRGWTANDTIASQDDATDQATAPTAAAAAGREQAQTGSGHLTSDTELASARPRMPEQQAVAITEAARLSGQPHTRHYAQHLLERYDTLRAVPSIHGHAAVDPDQLHDVVEEMRRLADTQLRHRTHQQVAATAAGLRAHHALDRLADHHRPADAGADPDTTDHHRQRSVAHHRDAADQL